jgi:hypothetical protein
MSIKPVGTWCHFAIENTVRGSGPGAVHSNSFSWTRAAMRGREAELCA